MVWTLCEKGASIVTDDKMGSVDADTDVLLDATTALIPPLLSAIEVLGYAGRHMHPTTLPDLLEQLAT